VEAAVRPIVRTLLAVLLAAGGALASVEPAAAAAGTDVPRAPGGTYACPGGSTVTVASNGSVWRPLRLSPSGAKFTPTGYGYQLVVDGTVTVEITDLRAAGTVTCTATAPQVGEDGTSVIGTFIWSLTGNVGH
jgi:hypothetical protein